MKLLSIDYGESKVGVAVGDSETGLALPLLIKKNEGRDQLIAELLALAKSEGAEKIIVGLPINTRMEASAQTERVRGFAAELKRLSPIEIIMYDERFSSQEAQKLRRGKNDDDLAAMLVLQSYLDKARIEAGL